MEFIDPDFIQNNNPEDIQERMMNNLPKDIDHMPGGFPYDFTMPTAIEKSELIQFHMVRTLMLMFPMWAWGEWLDYHGYAAGVKRRPAGNAAGLVTVEGVETTVIPQGTIFATPSVEEPSMEYKSDAEAQIKENGVVQISVTAVEPGIKPNVMANTVTLLSKPIKGITRIYNSEPITGGTQQEDDLSFRQRIQEANEADASFVGNNGDYVRWAKEITGVGAVQVIQEWDGPGTVKLVITDSNGQPANEHILTSIYDYIMAPDAPLYRRAPIGARVTIQAPALINVLYSATLTLKEDYSLETVKTAFEKKLLNYYEQVKNENEIKYNRVLALLASLDGVDDFTEFKINGEIDNIPVADDEYPQTSTEGMVI